MILDLITGQRAATVILNGAVAVFAAAPLALGWLGGASSSWSCTAQRKVGRWAAGSLAAALFAHLALLWLKAAEMAEVPLAEASGAVRAVITESHYGLAWGIGMGALILAGLCVLLARRGVLAGQSRLLVFIPLCIFWYAQCMTSHASMDGDFQLFMLVYSIHLGLISLWVGGVVVAGLVVLGSAALAHEQERRERAAYVLSLSKTATVALIGIFGSGLYLAWQLLGSLGDLFGTQYGITLLAKLVLVGAAAAMGGINRFFVMPGLAAGEVPGQRAAMRFRTVLRAEALVLLAVLVVAAVLSSSPPPGAGM